jgi:LPS-assembly protein
MGPAAPAPPSVAQPDKPVSAARPRGFVAGAWHVQAVTSEMIGSVRHLVGNAELEDAAMHFKADEIHFNEETGDVKAEGNVYYKNFERKEEIWCDRLEYNTDDEKGKFYNVRGQGYPRIDARPGVLTSSSPFFFHGEWAERLENRYILHNGFITNCKMPKPWWRLKGPTFVIEPGKKATAYRSVFMVRRVPILYFPFFYKSLEKMPRKSGFLTPNIGNSSRRGKMIGVGYFWAINRSYDVTYLLQDFTARGFAHHVDFRGKPRVGTDFDAIYYGVQDRGAKQNDGSYVKYGGSSLFVVGKSDLGNGYYARGQINYISSLRFRREFTESYTDLLASEVHSVGFVNKSWSYFTANAIFARLENFQDTEVNVSATGAADPKWVANSVVIRKLPEVELSGRDRQLWRNLPIWFSFESSAGLLYREQPVFEGNTLVERYETGQFMNRVNLAPRVTTAFHWRSFHLVPSFALHETSYSESQQPYLDRFHTVGTSLLRSARDVSVDLVFPSLERVFNFHRKTFLGEKLKHVIEPRVTYRYVSGIGLDFDRFVRFDETELLSNTSELEISLTNRFYAKRGDRVDEIFSWQLRQKRYFDPTFGGAVIPGRRNVLESSLDLSGFTFLNGYRNVSPVVSVLRASPLPGLGVEWRSDYDSTRGGIVNSTAEVNYRWANYFARVAQSAVRTDPVLSASANQVSVGFGFGDSTRRGWNAAFQSVYDYRQAIMQYAVAGVTYNTDCCGVSFQYRRINVVSRPGDDQWRVSFSVANIGSFGTLKKQERIF